MGRCRIIVWPRSESKITPTTTSLIENTPSPCCSGMNLLLFCAAELVLAHWCIPPISRQALITSWQIKEAGRIHLGYPNFSRSCSQTYLAILRQQTAFPVRTDRVVADGIFTCCRKKKKKRWNFFVWQINIRCSAWFTFRRRNELPVLTIYPGCR